MSGQCRKSSWRGTTKATQPYGPGDYNRCVLDRHHGGRHIDSWGNVFRLKPTFRIMGRTEARERES